MFDRFGGCETAGIKHTAFDEESDFQVKNKKFRSPGAKTEEKLPHKNLFRLYVSSFFIWFPSFIGS